MRTWETDRPQPASPYAVTKLAEERLRLAHSTQAHCPTGVVALQYFTVYGPGSGRTCSHTVPSRVALVRRLRRHRDSPALGQQDSPAWRRSPCVRPSLCGAAPCHGVAPPA
ncbi:NAD-dependent epimerase/dehydratase family protein [Streptomyces sp. P9-A4]|uniref:NAD-dependent epimerase/dehydratase family protein n=1 Tax=Streptomyces sp. P9-A4 TaxID=3072285 RepID=UPI002FCA93E9